MDTQRVGDISEIAVQKDLLEHDIDVSVPVGKYPYDLIAEIGGTFYTIQVKTLHLRQDQQSALAVDIRDYSDGDFDIIAGYWPETESTYYEHWDNLGSRRFSVFIGDYENLEPRHKARVNKPETYSLQNLIETFK